MQPPAQFSKLGIQVSLAIMCLFVWAMVGWITLPLFFFNFFTLLKVVCSFHVHVEYKDINIHVLHLTKY